jgi:hypothetical protein
MARRRRQHTKTRPTMFWDHASKAYALKVDDNDEFFKEINFLCNTPPKYSGDPMKVWFIDEEDVEAVKTAVAAYFPAEDYGPLDFIPKPDRSHQRQRAADRTAANGAGKSALTMFEIGGYQSARKVYSLLINEFHPDRNKSPEANAKAAEITLAWRELKSHFGWS